MNTNYRGDFSELLVMASAISAGHAVARVYGNSKPFDLLVEMADGTWIRVQVKTVLMRRKNKFIPCQPYGTDCSDRTGRRGMGGF